MYRLIAAALLVIAASSSASAQNLPDVGPPVPLPVPSYWVGNHGSQLKFYAIDEHGNFSGVFVSPNAPPGCQDQTFEARGGFFFPQIAIAVEWKNWTQDCHGRTLLDGILVHGHKLSTEWSFMTETPDGTLHNTKHWGLETFRLQP